VSAKSPFGGELAASKLCKKKVILEISRKKANTRYSSRKIETKMEKVEQQEEPQTVELPTLLPPRPPI